MGRTEPGRGPHSGRLLLGPRLLDSCAPPTSTGMTALCAHLVPPSPAGHAHPGPGAHHAPPQGAGGLESSDPGRAVEVTSAPSDTRRHGRPRSLGRGWPGACPQTLTPHTPRIAGCPKCDPRGHLGPVTFPSFAHGPLAWPGPPSSASTLPSFLLLPDSHLGPRKTPLSTSLGEAGLSPILHPLLAESRQAVQTVDWGALVGVGTSGRLERACPTPQTPPSRTSSGGTCASLTRDPPEGCEPASASSFVTVRGQEPSRRGAGGGQGHRAGPVEWPPPCPWGRQAGTLWCWTRLTASDCPGSCCPSAPVSLRNALAVLPKPGVKRPSGLLVDTARGQWARSHCRRS